MAPPSTRRPSRRRRRPQVAGWRVGLALAILVGGVALVALLVRQGRHAEETVSGPPPSEVVAQVAGRHGVPAQAVVAEEIPGEDGGWWSVTVHAPAGFDLQAFLLALEAEAHNNGGRLDPLTLTEHGGYGLAAMQGTISGAKVRVVVLGEASPPRPAPRPTPRPAAPPARLAIVLDDAGNSLEPLPAIAALPRAIAVAVLPDVEHSAEVAAALAGQGREVLLHMPMQPIPGPGPAPGADVITVGMTEEQVADRLRSALAVVVQASGVNNHMGSRATADATTMRYVMEVLRQRPLYFLDSRTTGATVAERVAREAGVPALRRDVFLDVVGEDRAIRRALAQAVERAQAHGSAVAIGHVNSTTLAVLADEAHGLLAGVELVPPSALVADAPGR